MTKQRRLHRSVRVSSDWRRKNGGLLLSLLWLGSKHDVACCFVATRMVPLPGVGSSKANIRPHGPRHSWLQIPGAGPSQEMTRTATTLNVDMLRGNSNRSGRSSDNDLLDVPRRESSVEDRVVVAAPALISLLAFTFYEDTSKSFHSFVEFASRNTWEAVDGGAYLSDLIGPALNGPVTTCISLLFGTLTSMTMASLYDRQSKLSQTFSVLVEDVRLADIHFGYLPPDARARAGGLLRLCAAEMLAVIEEQATVAEMDAAWSVRRTSTEQLMAVLHDLSTDPLAQVDGCVMGEAYGTLNRIIASRCAMDGFYAQRFPVWHYGNLGLMGTAICVIFFILTDRSALVFLGAFQLKLCWAMLAGTMSVMSVVIYDLNTPLTGVFQIVKEADRQFLKRFTADVNPNMTS